MSPLESLIEGAETNNTELMLRAIEEGADVNSYVEDYNALGTAINYENIEAINFLLKHNADFGATKYYKDNFYYATRSPIGRVFAKQNQAILDILYKTKVSLSSTHIPNTFTILHFLLDTTNPNPLPLDQIKFLIDGEVVIDIVDSLNQTPLYVGIKSYINILRKNLPDSNEKKKLLGENIKWLIDQGANVHSITKNKDTPLSLATKKFPAEDLQNYILASEKFTAEDRDEILKDYFSCSSPITPQKLHTDFVASSSLAILHETYSLDLKTHGYNTSATGENLLTSEI